MDLRFFGLKTDLQLAICGAAFFVAASLGGGAQAQVVVTENPAQPPVQAEAPVQGFTVEPLSELASGLATTEETVTNAAVSNVQDPATEAPSAVPATGIWALFERSDATRSAGKMLHDGGPAIWAIAALSVVTMALILWKFWRLALIGAWSQGQADKAVTTWQQGGRDEAVDLVKNRRGLRSKVVCSALQAKMRLPDRAAREETTRVAKMHLAEASTGLRALELIATIAPLLGLLGTVMGMIAAFQALQDSGSRADPALLAGGIWEALLTTAAGMAVAIPASAALTWYEAVIDHLRRDVEDAAARIFIVQETLESTLQGLAAE